MSPRTPQRLSNSLVESWQRNSHVVALSLAKRSIRRSCDHEANVTVAEGGAAIEVAHDVVGEELGCFQEDCFAEACGDREAVGNSNKRCKLAAITHLHTVGAVRRGAKLKEVGVGHVVRRNA